MGIVCFMAAALCAQDPVALEGACRTSEGQPAVDIEIILCRLEPGKSLQGRAIPDNYHPQRILGTEKARTKTDAKGAFVFAALPPGLYHFSPAPYYPNPSDRAFHEDFPERLIQLENAQRITLEGRRAGRWVEVCVRTPHAPVDLWDPTNHRALDSRLADASGIAKFYFHDDSEASPIFRAGALCVPAERPAAWRTSRVEAVLQPARPGTLVVSLETGVGERPVLAMPNRPPMALDAGGTTTVASDPSDCVIVAEGAGIVWEGRLKEGEQRVNVHAISRARVPVRVTLSDDGVAVSPRVQAMLLERSRLVLRPRGADRSPLLLPNAPVGTDGLCAFHLTQEQRAALSEMTVELWSAFADPRRPAPIFHRRLAIGTLTAGFECGIEVKSLLAGLHYADALQMVLLAEAFGREADQAGEEADRASFRMLQNVCKRLAEQQR
ncbi:MAG: hypothetical protein HYY16_12410 [Planctomycetes bacterium]|nr:hypothetical protein [Planctomycetota bacterium]